MQTAGGVLGQVVGLGLARGLKALGATLLLLAAWMAGLAIAFHVSLLDVFDAHRPWLLVRPVSWIRDWSSSRREVAEGQERKRERAGSRQAEAGRRRPRRAWCRVIEPPAPVVEKSERAQRERQVTLFDRRGPASCRPCSCWTIRRSASRRYSAEALEAMSRLVEIKLKDFGVDVEVVAVHPGPVVTRFELQPAPGTKASQISGLSKDLARALSAISVRVVEVIPGKSVMGLEIPNEKREMVTLGEIIKSTAYEEISSPLALALGKDIGGHPVVADLAQDAAPADRRHHRLGQVGGHQCHGAVAALQEHGRACAA